MRGHVGLSSRTLNGLDELWKELGEHERQNYREVDWTDLKAAIEVNEIKALPMDTSWKVSESALKVVASDIESQRVSECSL